MAEATTADKVVSDTKTDSSNNNAVSRWTLFGKLKEPGKFEDCARLSQEVVSSGEAFDGIHLEVGGMFSESFQYSNTFHLGSSEETPNYSLTLVNTNPRILWGPTLVGKIDSEMKLFTRSIWQKQNFTGLLTCVYNRESPMYLGGEAEFKYKGTNLYGKFDNQLNLTASIFQSVSKRTAVGCEHTIVPSQNVQVTSFGGRYAHKGHTGSLIFSSMSSLNLNYSYKKHNVQVGTELALAVHPQNGSIVSKTSAGIKYHFHASVLKLRADTEGAILGMYEEIINNSFKLCLCAVLNYKANDYKIGVGLQVNK